MIKKTNASENKQADYVFVQQLKADHQGSQNFLTDVRWIGRFLKRNGPTKQQLFVRKSWHQQSASASSHKIASVRTPETYTRYTNHATRIENRSGRNF